MDMSPEMSGLLFDHRPTPGVASEKGSAMRVFLAVATAALVLGSALAQDPGTEKAGKQPAGTLDDLKSKASYSYGYSLGRNLKLQGVDMDAELIARGLLDAIGGSSPALKDQDMQAALQTFGQQFQVKQAGMASRLAATNKAQGEKFLSENKAKPGVVTLPSGLQYKILKEGTGEKPRATDTVTVHYEGKLVDGTVFDSSHKRGQPASFQVKGVIPGWTEALQLMPVGSTWQLFIPSNLAYGAKPPPGGLIGPNAVLTFQVQLLKIGE
jgi:FKBP-type peptidyl-prolyl cis-trans isomerase FklB